MSYSVLEILRRSQFSSRTVSPEDIPNICVCTAPDTPAVHRSDEEPPIEGLIAEGGGDITTVLPLDLTSESLLVVVLTSVTAFASPAYINTKKAITVKQPYNSFLI
tara:strand:- start:1120 stop:1437 length:318 start_codon:yes stop_codon:yes gene_type:complete